MTEDDYQEFVILFDQLDKMVGDYAHPGSSLQVLDAIRLKLELLCKPAKTVKLITWGGPNEPIR